MYETAAYTDSFVSKPTKGTISTTCLLDKIFVSDETVCPNLRPKGKRLACGITSVFYFFQSNEEVTMSITRENMSLLARAQRFISSISNMLGQINLMISIQIPLKMKRKERLAQYCCIISVAQY